MINNDATLDNACDLLGHSLSTPAMIRVLSRILDLPIKGVEAAVNPTGILSRSGLLTVNRNGGGTLRGKLDLLSISFADRMLSTDADPVALLRGTVALAPPPQLVLSDYGHLGVSLDFLRPYLKIALTEKRRGVNIFLHGPPGTGKTQLARRLALDLRSELFEVSSEDEEGDFVDGEHRLRAYA